MSLFETFKEGRTEAQLAEASAKFLEAIDNGKVDMKKLRGFGLRRLYEAIVGPELPMYRWMSPGQESGANQLMYEEVSGPRLSAFTNITGKMVLDGVLEGFTAESLVADGLFEVFTDADDGGRWGGIDWMDDDALEVKEGHEYPNSDFGEDFVDTPFSVKRGLKIGLTREMVHFDKTGLLIQRARQVGERVGVNRENRMIDTLLGLDNPYKRKGTFSNTYKTTGSRPNLLTGVELVDWTDIEEALQLFSEMTDDRADGEPIEVTPSQLIVMPRKLFTARRILNATEVRHTTGANAVADGAGAVGANDEINTLGANPITENYELFSTNRMYQRLQKAHTDVHQGTVFAGLAPAAAQKVWFLGNFKKTFKYRTIFPMEVLSAGAEHPAFFDKDVVMQFRASERGVPFVVDPWNVMRVEG